MSASTLSKPGVELWAKSPRSGEAAGESLVAHTLWVLRNMRAFAARAPHLAVLCSQESLIDLAVLAVILHDSGKAAAGFQLMLRDGARFEQRHEVLSLALLPWVFGEAAPPSAEMIWVASAIVTHHKNWWEIQQKYTMSIPGRIAPSLENLRPQLTKEFFEQAQGAVRQTLQCGLREGLLFPSRWEEAIQQAWSPQDGVVVIHQILMAVDLHMNRLQRQWLPAPDLLAGRFLRGLMMLADHSGSAHTPPRSVPSLESVDAAVRAICRFPASQLRAHQLQARATKGSALLIAPTGSGKTEAAILWAARQLESSDGHPPLFYVLPFQASLNAMRWRLGDAFSAESSVTLQHSRSLQALYSRWFGEDGCGRREAEMKARKERSLARLHTTPVRVLTPYQLLRGAYQLPGHEALFTDAVGGLFVFDEIHAYEPERLGMILAMLRHLVRDQGARVLAMSATMPGCLADLITGHCGIPPGNRLVASPETPDSAIRHRVHLVPEELLSMRVLGRAAEDAAAGKAVLLVATTVARAQQAAFELVQDGRFTTKLLHGRFNARDRGAKEKELLEQLGVGAVPRKRGAALVATQVVEVSLDVDFDVLYSDPAPLEALLQRFGRVNRSRPAGSQLCPVHVCTTIPDGSPVYGAELLKLALDQLARFDGQPLQDSEIQNMLDAIYTGDFALVWANKIREASDHFERDALRTARPFNSDPALEKKFDELFDGFEVIPYPLLAEHESLLDTESIVASSLAVPISGAQFRRLCRQGRMEFRPDCLVADCAYTPDQGLDLTATGKDDGI